MTRFLLILVTLLVVAVTPVMASKEDNKGKQPRLNDTSSGISKSDEDCDPQDEWKNHGQYVSCAARMEDRDDDDIKEAAQSDIGKKGKKATPSATPILTITPTSTPSATPSASPTPTSTASAQVTEDTKKAQIIELKALIAVLKDILESLKHLI